ncbi:glycoprotein 96-92-related-related [Anaeramoeba flamelloides]|uniref:Glycoprotein 96-92-related-related n=1 Tax=Anaeramoeba flamelloides TaxID=1746091 RepID=A0ABQ8Y6J2_9EUKA|nr:glycoprotein 96-92-related-related [Anaeramoeba flamelloides]
MSILESVDWESKNSETRKKIIEESQQAVIQKKIQPQDLYPLIEGRLKKERDEENLLLLLSLSKRLITDFGISDFGWISDEEHLISSNSANSKVIVLSLKLLQSINLNEDNSIWKKMGILLTSRQWNVRLHAFMLLSKSPKSLPRRTNLLLLSAKDSHWKVRELFASLLQTINDENSSTSICDSEQVINCILELGMDDVETVRESVSNLKMNFASLPISEYLGSLSKRENFEKNILRLRRVVQLFGNEFNNSQFNELLMGLNSVKKTSEQERKHLESICFDLSKTINPLVLVEWLNKIQIEQLSFYLLSMYRFLLAHFFKKGKSSKKDQEKREQNEGNNTTETEKNKENQEQKENEKEKEIEKEIENEIRNKKKLLISDNSFSNQIPFSISIRCTDLLIISLDNFLKLRKERSEQPETKDEKILEKYEKENDEKIFNLRSICLQLIQCNLITLPLLNINQIKINKIKEIETNEKVQLKEISIKIETTKEKTIEKEIENGSEKLKKLIIKTIILCGAFCAGDTICGTQTLGMNAIKLFKQIVKINLENKNEIKNEIKNEMKNKKINQEEKEKENEKVNENEKDKSEKGKDKTLLDDYFDELFEYLKRNKLTKLNENQIDRAIFYWIIKQIQDETLKIHFEKITLISLDMIKHYNFWNKIFGSRILYQLSKIKDNRKWNAFQQIIWPILKNNLSQLNSRESYLLVRLYSSLLPSICNLSQKFQVKQCSEQFHALLIEWIRILSDSEKPKVKKVFLKFTPTLLEYTGPILIRDLKLLIQVLNNLVKINYTHPYILVLMKVIITQCWTRIHFYKKALINILEKIDHKKLQNQVQEIIQILQFVK